MANATAKLSASVPRELARALRRHVPPRGLSGFVARAIAHELEREQLGSLLHETQQLAEPISARELARARRAWPRR